MSEKDPNDPSNEGFLVPYQVLDESVGRYTRAQLSEMKRKGLPKPPDITWTQWRGPRRVSPRTLNIAWMAAQGIPHGKIAAELGLKSSRISAILSSDRMRKEIQKIQHKHLGRATENRFQRMIPKADAVVEQILDNTLAKDSVRLAAAKEVYDRAHGKAVQQVDINDKSTIRSLFELLDQRERARAESTETHEEVVVEAESRPVYEDAQVVEPEKPKNPNDVEPAREDNPNVDHGKIDRWLDENLK